MAPVVVWIIVALVAGLGVVLVASASEGRSNGGRRFFEDLRSGLSKGRRSRARTIVADVRREHAELADVETSSVEEIFEIGRQQEAHVDSVENAYVDTGEIAETLSRATHRAVRGVTSLARR